MQSQTPRERMGGAAWCVSVVMALNIMFESHFASPDRCIFSSPSLLRIQLPVCMCTCNHRAVRLQGLCVRCKCEGTQLPRRQWGEEGGSEWGSKGVNWAVIVKEAGSDWVKMTRPCSLHMRHFNCILFFFIFLPSFSFCLWITRLSSWAEPLKYNVLCFTQPLSL